MTMLFLWLSGVLHVHAADPPGPVTGTVNFESLPAPAQPATRVHVSPKAMWFGQEVALTYQRLATTGTPIGDSRPFAALYDAQGKPIISRGKPRLCNGLDGASLLEDGDDIYSVIHAECHPGALQLSRLEQDAKTGALTALSTTQVDFKALGGANLFCAGERTPWGTHLAAEEFEADASKLQADGTVSDNHQYYNNMARYWGGLTDQSPYQVGWIDELKVHDGTHTVAKRYALGRFSHEQARVMPDQRTVYLTDDGTNGAFFVFVADTAGDLSSGELYASAWTQADDSDAFTLAWVPLGHADEETVGKAVTSRIAFDAMFEVQDGPTCNAGFRRIRTTHESRCIAVRPGMEMLASRLESRRVAALKGATTELRKWEGMAIDAAARRLYVAVSAVTHGMVAGHAEWDLPDADHVRLPENGCGMVMGLDVGTGAVTDTQGRVIQSEWIVSSAQSVIAGQESGPRTESGYPRCAIDGIANPDNLAFMPEANLLLIAEDTHGHDNNVLWAMQPQTKALQRLAIAPVGAEVAGLNWFSDVGGFGYLTLTFQFSDADWQSPEETGGEPLLSHSGVIGPFPVR